MSAWHVEEWATVGATTVVLAAVWWACLGAVEALVGVGLLWGLWWLVDAL